MITYETNVEIVKLVGQYLVDHATELYPVEYNDLTGNEIFIHMKRRKEFAVKEGDRNADADT